MDEEKPKKKRKKAVAADDGAGEHKRSWQENLATMVEIKAFVNDRYYLRADYGVLNEGSGGAGHSAYVLNSVTGDGLVPSESVFTYFDGQPNDGYYHARDGYRYEPTSYDEYLTEQQFSYFVGAWEDSVYVPQLTMIA